MQIIQHLVDIKKLLHTIIIDDGYRDPDTGKNKNQRLIHLVVRVESSKNESEGQMKGVKYKLCLMKSRFSFSFVFLLIFSPLNDFLVMLLRASKSDPDGSRALRAFMSMSTLLNRPVVSNSGGSPICHKRQGS